MNFRRITYLATSTAALFSAALFAVASANAQDPPSRVARLNWIDGSVSFQPAGVDTWTAATPNYPLTTGDHIYTDDRSRAEMHVGPNAIRLSSLANFGYINLDDRTVQMRFTEGAMEVRVRNLADDDLYEIDTPQGAITLLRNGDYRIDCDTDRNATMITVRAGDVEVTANGQAFPVHARQTAFFSGDNQPDIRDANQPDPFDRFTADRNRAEETPRARQYVSPTMAGSEDLYTYGSWRDYPGYGSVWVPPARAGWAPYQYGRWAWVEPWGWTWIDDAPWGFAPFHYGRWAHVEVGWIWVPGPPAVRPVYAPALVAFVGGPRFGLSVSIGGGGGGVAWFPLGPQEIYRPTYHVSNTYVNQVNVTNVTSIKTVNITNVNVTNVKYVNQNVPGAMTSVPQNAFVSRQPVHQVMQPVTPQQAAQAQVVGAAPAVAPQRASLVGNGSSVVPHPAQAAMERQVVAKQTPPPVPVSFQAKQQALAQNPGRPVEPQAIQSLRAQQQRSQPAAAQFRPASAPTPARPAAVPVPQQAVLPNEPNRSAQPRPVTPQNVTPQRPAERLDSRPPSARPLTEAPRPVPQNQSNPVPRQEVTRPETARPTASRPEATRPEAERPAARPAEIARPNTRPEPAPKEEKREQKKNEKKEEKKEEKQK